MRGSAAVLFTVLFLVLALYATLGMADTSAYDRATANRSISDLESGDRAVFTGTIVAGDRPLAVRASNRRDFLSGLFTAASGTGEAAFLDLDAPAGIVAFDWSEARISEAARGDGDSYSGFGAGDRLTVFARVRDDGTLTATYISSMSPDDLVRDRFAWNVNVLIVGLLFLGGAYVLPMVMRRYGRWSRISVSFFGSRRRTPSSDASSCSDCQNSALLALDTCAGCGRPVELGPQAADIERALNDIATRQAGSVVVRAAGASSMRLLWAKSIAIEFRPGELTAKNTVRVRQEFSRLGIDCRRVPGAIWRIELGDSPRRGAQIVHALFLNAFHTESDYRVEVDSNP